MTDVWGVGMTVLGALSVWEFRGLGIPGTGNSGEEFRGQEFRGQYTNYKKYTVPKLNSLNASLFFSVPSTPVGFTYGRSTLVCGSKHLAHWLWIPVFTGMTEGVRE